MNKWRKKKLTSIEKTGKIISRILEPIFEIPLILTAVTLTAYLNGFRWRFLALLLFLDAVVPGLYFLYIVFIEKSADWDMSKKEQRMPLYRVAVASHLAGVLVAFLINREPIAQILLSFWLLALLFSMITNKWKISLHAGVNSALATTGILVMGWHRFWWLISLPIIVSWARVVYKKHTLMQVIAGALLPAIILPFCWWAFKI